MLLLSIMTAFALATNGKHFLVEIAEGRNQTVSFLCMFHPYTVYFTVYVIGYRNLKKS
jgi:hypothetical protein